MNYSTNSDTILVSASHATDKETQPKPLNKKIQKYLRCIKRLEQVYSVTSKTELAEVTGVSRMYLQRKVENIEAYYRTAPIATDDDMKWYHDRSLDYYVRDAKDARIALGDIVGYLMKHRYGLLGHLHKVHNIKLTGNDVIALVVAIKSRKHKTGVSINSHSHAARNLLKHNKVAFIDKLFSRTGGYYAGHATRLWKTLALMDNILADAIAILFDKITNKKVNFVLNGSGSLCYSWRYTYSSIMSPSNCNTINKYQQLNKHSKTKWYIKPLIMPFRQVQQLCLTSMLHIISQSIGFVHDNFVVSLNHISSTNPALGRSYNVFTRLQSLERKQLGYFNYDMSCALQTISLQLIQASESDYPLLMRYSKDINFKRRLRKDISTSLGITVSDVKAKLTAFANGSVSGIDKHPHYQTFQKESNKLRIEVLAHTAKHNQQLLKQAIAQSKKKLPEDINWFSTSTEDSQALARGKASVYFFVWTYYERLIRKAMLTILTNGIEVHDAVYSKMDVSTDDIEATIFESTGFKMIIDKE